MTNEPIQEPGESSKEISPELLKKLETLLGKQAELTLMQGSELKTAEVTIEEIDGDYLVIGWGNAVFSVYLSEVKKVEPVGGEKEKD